MKERPAVLVAVKGWFSGACNDASPVPGAEPAMEAGCVTCGKQLGQSVVDDKIGEMYTRAEAEDHYAEHLGTHQVIMIKYDKGTHSSKRRR